MVWAFLFLGLGAYSCFVSVGGWNGGRGLGVIVLMMFCSRSVSCIFMMPWL